MAALVVVVVVVLVVVLLVEASMLLMLVAVVGPKRDTRPNKTSVTGWCNKMLPNFTKI